MKSGRKSKNEAMKQTAVHKIQKNLVFVKLFGPASQKTMGLVMRFGEGGNDSLDIKNLHLDPSKNHLLNSALPRVLDSFLKIQRKLTESS